MTTLKCLWMHELRLDEIDNELEDAPPNKSFAASMWNSQKHVVPPVQWTGGHRTGSVLGEFNHAMLISSFCFGLRHNEYIVATWPIYTLSPWKRMGKLGGGTWWVPIIPIETHYLLKLCMEVGNCIFLGEASPPHLASTIALWKSLIAPILYHSSIYCPLRVK